jgi:hypothetical protein
MTTLITDGFGGEIPCTCSKGDEAALEDHEQECAIVQDALAELRYFDWYLGDGDA